MKLNTVVMLTTDSNIDRRILQEADSLESAGWKVVIIAMPTHGTLSSDDNRIFRCPLKSNKSLFLLTLYRWMSKHMPLAFDLRTLIGKIIWRKLNIEDFHLNIFKNAIDKHHAAVFVAHDLPTLPAACYGAAKYNAKVVYDSHELYTEQAFSDKEKIKWEQLEQKYIGCCSSIITVNNLIAHALKQKYNLLPKVHIISNALPYTNRINTSSKIFHQKFNLETSIKIVLFQGGLTPNRNLENLVKSIAYVKNPHIHLVILGEGPLKRLLQAIVVKYKINTKVHFHQAVAQEELLNYTSCADLGIVPYQPTCLNNYYCTPNKLFEFIAAAVPVLSEKIPSIEKIIKQYQIGVTQDISSHIKIAKNLDLIFQEKPKIEYFKKNACKASKKIVWESQKFINIFDAYK